MKMPKTAHIASGLALLLTIVMTGCSQNPQMNGNADSTDKPGLLGRIFHSPKPVTVPVGTDLRVVLEQSISTAENRPGDSFKATLASPIVIDGKTVILNDTPVTGHIVDAQASGRLKGVPRLELTLDSIEVDGKSYDIATSEKGRIGKNHNKRNGALIGGGAGLGALIGGIAGGPKGALIGGAAGAALEPRAQPILGRKTSACQRRRRSPSSLLVRLRSPLRVKSALPLLMGSLLLRGGERLVLWRRETQ